MELKVELELREVYGGDGATRTVEEQRPVLTRSRSTQQTKVSLGVAVSDTVQEKKTEAQEKAVHTFRRDDEGAPILRLGGPHGKIWGALKEAAQKLRSFGDKDFSSFYAIVNSIDIEPAWVPLTVPNGDGVRVESMPQILAGAGGKRMIVERFDVIPKCTATVRLFFPDPIEPRVRKLLKALERGGHLNKRRASIRLASVEKVEGGES